MNNGGCWTNVLGLSFVARKGKCPPVLFVLQKKERKKKTTHAHTRFHRKMVNVTSHLPFNLHNRTEDFFANSRSGSRSMDMFHPQGYEGDDTSHPRQRHRHHHHHHNHNHQYQHRRHRWSSQERYPSASASAPASASASLSRPSSVYERQTYGTSSRPASPDSLANRAPIRREPILGVRLVGYTPQNRGRSMRSSDSRDSGAGPDAGKRSPSSGREIARSTTTAVADSSSVGGPGPAAGGAVTQEPYHMEFQAADLICTSWGD
ncbi:hypothetical protein AX15_003397 [Amanita polypyramis BW_CC]|nr:hypothetical protein AX15_003397 [Amanita polypyramis BW_CC]